VRSTGGLKDTVIDMGDKGGFGIRFDQASVWDINYSVGRAIGVYADTVKLMQMRRQMMKIDNSWDKSASEYISVYRYLRWSH
jgi:starch synthase